MKLPGLEYDSPNRFTKRQRLVLTLLPPLITSILRGICATNRLEIHGLAHWKEGIQQGKGRTLTAIWHESLGLAAYYFRGTNAHTLTSYSYDGELAARAVHCLGLEAVRGSSSRGGSDALHQLVEAAKRVEVVGFTLDGPRGPRRIAKPGIALLAARTGLPVVPAAFSATRAHRLHSWDHFLAPLPFGRITVAFGAPIAPPPSGEPDTIEPHRLAVETALNALHETIETN